MSYFAVLLRHRRLVMALPVGVFALALAVGLLRPGRYFATSTIRPRAQESANARMAGLAAQFGINLPATTSGDPIKFYAALLQSRSLLVDIVRSPYAFASDKAGRDTLHGDLIALFDARGATTEDRLRRAVHKLGDRIEVTTDREAGLVRLRVTTPWPKLSEQINRRFLDRLSEIDLKQRQTQASAERQFVEGRLEEARTELYGAEEAIERFLQSNRRYQDSPPLNAEFHRLQRRVDLRQQVFLGLSQAYEQARLDEVRNTPVLVVIDTPEASAEKAGNALIDASIWAILSLFVAIAIAIGREFAAQQRRDNPAEYEEFRELVRSASFSLLPGDRERRFAGPKSER